MSRYRRPFTGPTYFFTVVSHRRRPILCGDSIRIALRRAIDAVRFTRPFSIDGWVLLPDHMHCVWTRPENDHDFSTRWSEIKRFVSTAVRDEFRDPRLLTRSRRARRESTIWQRRFWEHMIRDELDMERHLDYVHFNPMKHGHVQRVVDWPYSTFRRYVQEGGYPVDWGGTPGLSDMNFE